MSSKVCGPRGCPQRAVEIANGTRLNTSDPAATAILEWPVSICCAADRMAWSPEAQARVTQSAGIASERPPFTETTRAANRLSRSVGTVVENTK
jgi:hypothetical protein